MELSIDGFRFSRHALGRALDMLLDPNEIRKCLTRPERVAPCHSYPDMDLYYRDRLTISVARDSGVVTTILWRTDSHWRRDMRNRPAYKNGRRERHSA
jgi:hypothetical protein